MIPERLSLGFASRHRRVLLGDICQIKAQIEATTLTADQLGLRLVLIYSQKLLLSQLTY